MTNLKDLRLAIEASQSYKDYVVAEKNVKRNISVGELMENKISKAIKVAKELSLNEKCSVQKIKEKWENKYFHPDEMYMREDYNPAYYEHFIKPDPGVFGLDSNFKMNDDYEYFSKKVRLGLDSEKEKIEWMNSLNKKIDKFKPVKNPCNEIAVAPLNESNTMKKTSSLGG